MISRCWDGIQLAYCSQLSDRFFALVDIQSTFFFSHWNALIVYYSAVIILFVFSPMIHPNYT